MRIEGGKDVEKKSDRQGTKVGHREAFTAVLDELAGPWFLLRDQAKRWTLGFQCALMCRLARCPRTG